MHPKAKQESIFGGHFLLGERFGQWELLGVVNLAVLACALMAMTKKSAPPEKILTTPMDLCHD